jgi:hypothetical protein
MQKAVYYMLVASSDYDFDPQAETTLPLHKTGAASDTTLVERDRNSITEPSARPRYLSQTDAKRCAQLMTCLIDHFTPILFTAPGTPHIPCTDVFADRWISMVIQPGLESNAVYCPLETLQRMKETNWAKEGLCQSCVRDKHEEWTKEQRNIWDLMDDWLHFC